MLSKVGRAIAQAVSRRPGFVPGSVHMGFVMDKVKLGQVFYEFFGFPCQYHSIVALQWSIRRNAFFPGLNQIRRPWGQVPYNLLGMNSQWTLAAADQGMSTTELHDCILRRGGAHSLWGPVLGEGHQRTSHSRQKQKQQLGKHRKCQWHHKSRKARCPTVLIGHPWSHYVLKPRHSAPVVLCCFPQIR
jgi:1,2-phenylacetyl-CoA epoxidase PaaB subunit